MVNCLVHRPDETEDHPEGPVANGYQRNYVREARADILPSQTKRRHHNVNAEQDHADHVKVVLEQHVLSAGQPWVSKPPPEAQRTPTGSRPGPGG